jgi:hypothetical protein
MSFEGRNERGDILWGAKRVEEVKVEGWEILRMDAWKDRYIKGRLGRRIVELVNLKIYDLTAG